MHIKDTKKQEWLFAHVLFTAGYLAAFACSRLGHAYLSGVFLMLTALGLYLENYKKTENLVDLRGLFSLSWVGGEGLACLQLSHLQKDWQTETWLCFYLAYFCFIAGYDFQQKRKARRSAEFGRQKESAFSEVGRNETEAEQFRIKQRQRGNLSVLSEGKNSLPATESGLDEKNEMQAKRVLGCILFLSVMSLGCFLLEAVVLGFIPLFSPEPHAYSYFHITGVHYFTISCILIPALSVLYVRLAETRTLFRLAALGIGNVLAVSIPILCVSRFQLLFAVGFAAVVYLMLYRRVTWKMILGALVILIPVYVLLTVARRHDIEYLNGIFEMKYRKMPIFITQPYIYVVNNYENFNCMVEQLPAFSMGVRMLFPFFALTGLKFLFPQLINLPTFITKTELTTLTMFYDAYYDFGVAGMILFASALGILSSWLTYRVKRSKNPIAYLFYGQLAIYLGLSFFTTWFSNPTTWFWLVLTGGMYLWVGYGSRQKKSLHIE